ncbi:Transcriptional regulator, variant 2 [Basidiobolus ranarum]|uniref:Transcriptional regulator, variant 2 n=1 Tax=Basidiobolus ranarum TaxID=34480 RepID=A0ABR2WXT9_9FUNG
MEEILFPDSDSKLTSVSSSVNHITPQKTSRKRKAAEPENPSNHLLKAAQKLPEVQSPTVSLKSLPNTSAIEKYDDSTNKNRDHNANEKKSETLNQPKKIEESTLQSIKVPNQVPIQTYWNYVEEYFREFTENDIQFLETKSERSEPFIIPPLGKHYLEKWKDEDQSLSHKIEMSTLLETKNFDTFHVANVDLKNWNEIQCPALTDRILTSLLNEKLVDLSDSDSEESRFDSPVGSPERHHELVDMDERLRRDFRYLGILNDEDVGFFIPFARMRVLILSIPRLIRMRTRTMKFVPHCVVYSHIFGNRLKSTILGKSR